MEKAEYDNYYIYFYFWMETNKMNSFPVFFDLYLKDKFCPRITPTPKMDKTLKTFKSNNNVYNSRYLIQSKHMEV